MHHQGKGKGQLDLPNENSCEGFRMIDEDPEIMRQYLWMSSKPASLRFVGLS